VTTVQQRAKNLLNQWHSFQTNGVCADLWNIQEGKYRLESMATKLSAVLYLGDPNENLALETQCDRFQQELDKFKQTVYRDLLHGLQTK